MIWIVSVLLLFSLVINVTLAIMLKNAINEISNKEDNFGDLFKKLNDFHQVCSTILNDHRFVDDPTIRRFVVELKEIELYLRTESENFQFDFDIPTLPTPFQGYNKTLAENNR